MKSNIIKYALVVVVLILCTYFVSNQVKPTTLIILPEKSLPPEMAEIQKRLHDQSGVRYQPQVQVQSGLPGVQTIHKASFSGRPIQIFEAKTFQRDCSAPQKGIIRITQQSAHGNLHLTDGPEDPNIFVQNSRFAGQNPRFPCEYILSYTYTSDSDFKGVDTVGLEYISAEGVKSSQTILIEVQ